MAMELMRKLLWFALLAGGPGEVYRELSSKLSIDAIGAGLRNEYCGLLLSAELLRKPPSVVSSPKVVLAKDASSN
jgi:hypothetical protein